MRGTSAQRRAYKPVAKGGIVAVELSALSSNQRQAGVYGDMRQLFPGPEIGRREPPVSLSTSIQRHNPTLGFRIMMPRPTMTWISRGGAARAAARGDRDDLALRRSPKEDWREQDRVFTGNFPA